MTRLFRTTVLRGLLSALALSTLAGAVQAQAYEDRAECFNRILPACYAIRDVDGQQLCVLREVNSCEERVLRTGSIQVTRRPLDPRTVLLPGTLYEGGGSGAAAAGGGGGGNGGRR